MPGKSEKQKMLEGDLYLSSDPELVSAHLRAQALLGTFNATPADACVERHAILQELLGSLGEQVVIKPVFRCDYGFNISIGDRTFINYDCIFLDCATIIIGEDVQLGPGVHIYTATHPVEAQTRRSGLEFARPVTIKDGVWLGGGSIICPGVVVGEDTVVGAGSVVTRDLPPNVVAVGNPCRVIRAL
jgi:maltose O-acetyltransferase